MFSIGDKFVFTNPESKTIFCVTNISIYKRADYNEKDEPFVLIESQYKDENDNFKYKEFYLHYLEKAIEDKKLYILYSDNMLSASDGLTF